MTEVVGLAAGAATAAVLWLALRGTFAAPLFARTNHRGVAVPVGAGIILALTALVLAAAERGLVGLGVEQDELVGDTMLLVALGFGLLGLIDDLAAAGDDRGFAGHLGALRRGRLTTGGLKLLGGGAVAVLATGPLDADEPARLIVDALLVALAANLGNLFDRAPGRTIKVGALAGGALLLTHTDPSPEGLAVILGAALGLAWFDLGERLMLGDAGANVLGAAIGAGTVLVCSPGVRVAALLVVAALNVLSERVSFSRVIERTGPLRALDLLGRHPSEDRS
jgi:UDP-GlcNAc:undecaprenyl-phosphate GlcNAc-1-phosphate transferase